MDRYKLILILFLILLTPEVAHSGMMMMTGDGTSTACTECPAGVLACQNFEGTGYDNSETWAELVGTGGTVDEDDTTATVIRGSQQLKLSAGDEGETSSSTVTFAEKGEIWWHVIINLPDATPSSTTTIISINGAGINGYVSLLTTGKLRVYNGTEYCVGSATLSDGTAYHIWGHHKAESVDTAGDGEAQIWVGTTSTRPETGDCATPVTTGTSEAVTTKLSLKMSYQHTAYFDQIIVDDAEFTSVCP